MRSTVLTRTLYSYRSAKEHALGARAGRARTGKRDPNSPAVAPAPLPAPLLSAHLAAAAILARYRRVRSSGGLLSSRRRQEPRLRCAGERRAGGRDRQRRCTPPRRSGVPGTAIGVPGAVFGADPRQPALTSDGSCGAPPRHHPHRVVGGELSATCKHVSSCLGESVARRTGPGSPSRVREPCQNSAQVCMVGVSLGPNACCSLLTHLHWGGKPIFSRFNRNRLANWLAVCSLFTARNEPGAKRAPALPRTYP